MAMRASREARAAAAGRTVRVRIAAQVALAGLLAAVAAALLVWVAERPGMRLRLDWTSTGRNTLDPATRTVLERLPGNVDVDVFFRPMAGPLAPVAYEAQLRTLELLVLLRDASGGRVRVLEHELESASGIDAARARLQELALRQVEPGGAVVVSLGVRRSVLRLRGDLVDLDPGDPQGEFGPPRPARLLAFRAEAALVGAMLKISQGETLRALFTTGHGEPDLDEIGGGGLSALRTALEADGFEVDRFDGRDGGSVPEDCAVLAIVGPEQPFPEAEAEAIRAFVESGGRLVASPGREPVQGEGSLASLLLPWGIRIVTDGVVAMPRASATGAPLYGTPQCGLVRVWSEGMAAMHPATEALRRSGRYVDLPFARSLERAKPPVGGTVISILTTDDVAWRDLGGDGSDHDWTKNPAEQRGPFALGMTALFPPSRPPRAGPVSGGGAPGSVPECRVVCLGSALAFANDAAEVDRDLMLAAFDWAASREFRVSIAPRSRLARRIDVTQGGTLASVHAVALLGLPGLCLVLGVLTAWRRRRR